MPALRRSSRREQVLLRDTSPYGSRVLVVEQDRVATAAYLGNRDGKTVSAAWIANHRAAPYDVDPSRLKAGRVPAMPADRTKHPQGRPHLDPQVLEVVWFEEGDGVALLEAGRPLVVIPGWCDIGRGVPGYSRDAIGRGPFAFAFDDEAEELTSHVTQALAYWDWRRGTGAWEEFQQSALGHLLQRLGPGGQYWHDIGRQWRATAGDETTQPLVGVSERPARRERPGRPERPYGVLSTIGMSCQRVPAGDDTAGHPRIELALATTLPAQQAGGLFPWIAQYPWREVTPLRSGDTVRWSDPERAFPLGPPWEGVLLLDDPTRLDGPDAPRMTGFSFGGDPVRWLWIVPLTDADLRLADEEGSHVLITRLARDGRSWVFDARPA